MLKKTPFFFLGTQLIRLFLNSKYNHLSEFKRAHINNP